jgi:succinoglycan biosynthesis transport protein ExoP
MNLNQLLLALRVRYKIVLLTLVVAVVATVVISMMLPKTYMATTSLVVNAKGVDSVTGMSLPSQMMPGFIATQVDIIKSKAVALRAVDELKLADNPDAQRQFAESNKGGTGTLREWLADLILAKVDVAPSRESSVLSISFRGADPQFVAAVANAFATGYMQFSVQLKTEPAQQASGYITTRTKLLREQYELAQSRLSKYQKENNIFSADNRLDVETSRLNDLSSQLVQVQGQAMDASSRSRQATGNAGASPDVQNNALIQGLKSSLALAEAKFADTSQRLAPNHPQYIAAKSEVDKLRSTINEQIGTASSGINANARILQQRESELRAALTAQKAKVMELNDARGELTVLSNEAENARHAYELATQRFNQTNLESESKQTDIAVLSAASRPTSPSGPRVLLNALLSLVVGGILGVGAVLILELLDQRVRSASHLGDAFGLPVLGVIEKTRALPAKKGGPALPPPGANPALQA